MPFSFLRGAFGQKPGEPVCLFCDRDRPALRAMVAKDERTLICDECAALAVVAMDRAGVKDAARFEFTQRVLSTQLRELGAGATEEESRRLVVAALALNGGDPAPCYQLAQAAAGAGNPRAAVLAIGGIVASRREGAHWIELAVAHYELGEYEEAAAALEAMEREALDPTLAALASLNEVAIRLRLDQELAEGPLRELWSMLVRARAELRRIHGELYEPHLALALAECELLLGRPTAAATRLASLEGPASPLRLMLLGDIHAALEDPSESHRCYREALLAAAEGSPLREPITRRLVVGASPYR